MCCISAEDSYKPFSPIVRNITTAMWKRNGSILFGCFCVWFIEVRPVYGKGKVKYFSMRHDGQLECLAIGLSNIFIILRKGLKRLNTNLLNQNSFISLCYENWISHKLYIQSMCASLCGQMAKINIILLIYSRQMMAHGSFYF